MRTQFSGLILKSWQTRQESVQEPPQQWRGISAHFGPCCFGDNKEGRKDAFVPILFNALGNFFLSFFFFLFGVFLGPHLQQMEVPRLGGRIRAVAAGLRQSHSNTRSKSSRRPTPQLTATPDS